MKLLIETLIETLSSGVMAKAVASDGFALSKLRVGAGSLEISTPAGILRLRVMLKERAATREELIDALYASKYVDAVASTVGVSGSREAHVYMSDESGVIVHVIEKLKNGKFAGARLSGEIESDDAADSSRLGRAIAKWMGSLGRNELVSDAARISTSTGRITNKPVRVLKLPGGAEVQLVSLVMYPSDVSNASKMATLANRHMRKKWPFKKKVGRAELAMDYTRGVLVESGKNPLNGKIEVSNVWDVFVRKAGNL